MINLMEVIISFTLIVSSVSLIFAGIYSLRFRDYTPALSFGTSMALGSVWALSYVLEIITPDLFLKIIWLKIRISIIPFVPIAVLLTAAEHVQQTRWMKKRILFFLGLIPIINLFIVWLPKLEHFYHSHFQISKNSLIPLLTYSSGSWEPMIAAFSFGIIFVAIAMYGTVLFTTNGVYFWQTFFMLLGVLIPVLTGVVQSLLDYRLFPNYDLVPNMLFFTGILSLYALWRHQWLQVAPIARHQIVDNMQDAMLVIDLQDRLLDFNRRAASLFDLSHSHLSQPVSAIINGWAEINADLLSNKAVRKKLLSAQNDDDLNYEVFENKILDNDNKLVARILLLREITPERILQEKLSQLSQIVEQNPTAVMITDTEGIVQYINPVFTKLTGYTSAEIVGEKPSILKSGDVSEDVYEDLWKKLINGETWRGELINKKKDGSLYWEETTIAPIFDKQNKIINYVALKQDISHRKEIDHLLKRRLEEIRIINDISLAASSELDLGQLVNLVGKKLEQAFHVNSVFIAILDTENQQINVPYWTINKKRVFSPNLSIGMGLTSRVLDSKKPLLIDENFEEIGPKLGALLTFSEKFGVPKTWLGVPILSGQEALGVISIQDYENECAFSTDDINVLETIASNIAVAIHNAQLYIQTQKELLERKRAEADAGRRVEQMRILYEASQDLSSGLELQKLLKSLRNRCQQIAHIDIFSVATYHEQSQQLQYLQYQQGAKSSPNKVNRDLIKEPGLAKIALDNKKTFYIPDTIKFWNEQNSTEGSSDDENGRSFLGIPLLRGERITGLMTLQSFQAKAFNNEDIQLLETIASQAAAAIENARLFEETRRRADEMSILYEIGLDVSSNIRLEDVLRKVLEKCQQLLPLDAFYVAIYDETTKLIHHPFFYDNGSFLAMPARDIQTKPGISGEIITQRRTIYISDTLEKETQDKHQIIHAGGNPTRSFVGVPLIVRDKVVGVISIQSYTPNLYDSAQIRLFETIATQAAIAIENSKMYEKAQDEIDERKKAQESLEDQLIKVEAIQDELREQAYRDPLTSLHNRRYLNEHLNQKIALAEHDKKPLSIMMLDVDHFKKFNDTYGHEAGDLMLKKLSDILREYTRATDIACRYGGEEFLIAFPEMSIEVAKRRAEAIRVSFEEATIHFDEKTLSSTISIGVAAFPVHGKSGQEVVIQADQALYEAKSLGRNQVSVWSIK